MEVFNADTTEKTSDKKPTVSPATPKKPTGKASKEAQKTAEFKRKYFQYYDDIKTSDREDW